jgi:hypothetical protein
VAAASPGTPPDLDRVRVAAVFVAHRRGLAGAGAAGDPAWLGAAVAAGGRLVAAAALRPSSTSTAARPGQAAGATAAVQKAQRRAFRGMVLRHSGQLRVVGPAGGAERRASSTWTGLTTRK